MNDSLFLISYADDNEIDDVVDSIQARCGKIKQIEHIGINSVNKRFESNPFRFLCSRCLFI